MSATTTSYESTTLNGTAMNLNITDGFEELEMPSQYQIFVIYVISLGAFLNNLVVFYTLPKLRDKINTSTRYAMLNLAVTDGSLGCGLFIGRTVYLANPDLFLSKLCAIDAVFNPILASMSAWGLMYLNLDKYLSLKYILTYRVWMTRKKTICILSGMWFTVISIFAFCVGQNYLEVDYVQGTFACFLHIMSENKSSLAIVSLQFILLHLLPFIICLVSVTGMWRILKSHKKQASNLQEGQTVITKNDHGTVYTTFALNFIYILSVTPFFIFVSLWKLLTGWSAGPTSTFWTGYIGAANSTINPLIYIPSLRSYRQELKMAYNDLLRIVFCKNSRCRNPDRETSSVRLQSFKRTNRDAHPNQDTHPSSEVQKHSTSNETMESVA